MNEYTLFIFSHVTKSVINLNQKSDMDLTYQEAERRAELYLNRNPKTEIAFTDGGNVYHAVKLNNGEIDITWLPDGDYLLMLWGLLDNPYAKKRK